MRHLLLSCPAIDPLVNNKFEIMFEFAFKLANVHLLYSLGECIIGSCYDEQIVTMQILWQTADELDKADDWRANYHLSPAAVLPRLGENWPALAKSGVRLIDGWRFSDNPDSEWYLRHVRLLDTTKKDPVKLEYLPLAVSEQERQQADEFKKVIDHRLYYRMRHLGDMRLQLESEQFQLPELSDQEFCIQPDDVVLRRIGRAGAAYISAQYRRHPIDANLAIIRGLPTSDALWLSYCLEQPVYRAYLEQQTGITSLVRVGLKQLRDMPLAPKPNGFEPIANEYLAALDELNQAEESLFLLRSQVQQWLKQQLRGLAEPEDVRGWRCGFFAASDVSHRLDYAHACQGQYQRKLLEQGGKNLSALAVINPKETGGIPAEHTVLRISDVNDQLSFARDLSDGEKAKWRTQKRLIKQNDVIVSTFASDNKIAFVHDVQEKLILPSEQLVTLCFHEYQGAYALLMESPLVNWQIKQLTHGNLQSFIHPAEMNNLVIPKLDIEIGAQWHQQLLDIMQLRDQAMAALAVAKTKMADMFSLLHPVETK
ncbi:hypothetical protein [Photobacterium sp. OFAV2-7]|uniref:hypothetical protein n=1 Tax=Photobacterium sp. OFAV2-7 TaxID=2917748 RepID=UPI001EF6EB79|nr:hypothetical protein [Photobacterium sp. OFAV2-7]